MVGAGPPCQPAAFAPNSWRLAFAEGVNAFPRQLAAELAVERQVEVTVVQPDDGGWCVRAADGRCWRSRQLVVALPAGQAEPLLAGLAEDPQVKAARALLGLLGSHPCVAVIAGYAAGTGGPPWDVAYPETSLVLQLAAHDSAKRAVAAGAIMVYQALPCWSRGHLAADDASCAAAILGEAARLWGEWAGRPAWTQVHRWELARSDVGMELTRPLLPQLSTGQRLGLCGEVFAPGGGVEAAWLSGRALARRLIDEKSA